MLSKSSKRLMGVGELQLLAHSQKIRAESSKKNQNIFIFQYVGQVLWAIRHKIQNACLIFFGMVQVYPATKHYQRWFMNNVCRFSFAMCGMIENEE